MKKIKYLTLLLLFVFLTGCNDKIKTAEVVEPTEVKELDLSKPVLIENLNFEINSDVNLLSLISEDNKVEILTEDKKIDTSILGAQDLVISYKNGEDPQEYRFLIEVVDTTAPEIIGAKDITISVGKPVNLVASISVKDNSGEKLKATVEGKYDINKVGTYELKYVAIDGSNNKGEASFKLIVTKDGASQGNNNGQTNSGQGNNNGQTGNNQTGGSTGNSTGGGTTTQPENNYNPYKVDTSNTAAISSYLKSATYKYKISNNFGYVKYTNSFEATNKQDILNIIYTALNNGAEEFVLYCRYDACVTDFQRIAQDGTISYIQDYVHPYNTLTGIQYRIIEDEVTVVGSKKYTASDITNLENKMNSVMNSIVTSSMTNTEKVKAFHDYLVNNVKYGTSTTGHQQSAVGALLEGKSVCEGYTHAMSIFLNRIGVPNYRISVIGVHTWNLVYINGSWKHLDVTWDDPVTSNGSDMLRYDYFLVNRSVMTKEDKKGEHAFNTSIYKEA